MVDFIGTMSSAIEITKKLVSISSISKDADAKLMIAELQLNLAELKSTMADLVNENSELRSVIASHKTPRPTVTVKDGLYYTENGDGPFCTTCFDDKDKLIRLTEAAVELQVFGKYRCNVCKSKCGPST